MKYLIQQWIEALHKNSQCPRLMVDATIDGVDVPDRIRSQWGEAMPIDLDPQYPLDLAMTDEGIDCVLSFGGPYTCHFPWRSIYVVQDRESQLGIVIEENLPHQLALVECDGDEPLGERAGIEVPEPAPRLAIVDNARPAPAAPVDDVPSEVHDRRAAFRVIDGGKP